MARSGRLYDEICERTPSSLTGDMNVLELACGSGQLSFRLAGCVRLWEARKQPRRGRLRFSVQNATALRTRQL